MKLLDGKIVANKIIDNLKLKTFERKNKGQKIPHLAAILVGLDGASQTYVANKVKTCEAIGFTSTLIKLPAETLEYELLQKIEEVNKNIDIDGLIVQLPLPKHINEQNIIEAIDPSKDVDGFHPINVGRLVQGLPTFLPATPYGVMLMLKHYNINTAGKHAVIIGRSNIVGRPMSILLSQNIAQANCTVTLCHSGTKNMEEICSNADIIIAALGKPGFVKASMVKPGAVIIDVGITRIEDTNKKSGFALKGDVDFDAVKEIASFITPVPGGVGLTTIAGLVTNTMLACQRRNDD
jgi:methylenetetrahydrofolate dehydrogenase (NADP+) / methenyltetrahydrofolate cyclohydrolase